MPALPIEIWSDIACPWCWIGKRHLESAIASFDGEVEIVWRAFELDPTAPTLAPEQVDYAARLAAKYGTSRDEGQAMIDRMVDFGRSSGVEMRFDRIRPSNTFDAHRCLAFARARGLQTELKERLFRAYLQEGRSVSDHEVLVELSIEVGLDGDAARELLAGDALEVEVREDERQAALLGARAVPFFAIDGRLAVAGAHPIDVLLEAMRRAAGAEGSRVEADSR